MTKTFKILTTISFIAMAIVLTFVGVWALTDLDFTVGGDITYTAPKPTINLQQDANGFYVTMGTYNNSPVVWRLVGIKESGANKTTKFTGTTKPTSGTGTFILETYATEEKEFDESSNDYATSDIRAYLNGDYITTLNLANDATYNAIAERSVVDMYTDIGWNYDGYNSGYTKNAVYSITTTNTESDKLWLMSVGEVYVLLGGGTIGSDGIISDDWSNYLDYLYYEGMSYYFRSPSPRWSNRAFYFDTADWELTACVVNYRYSVRPAFNLEF